MNPYEAPSTTHPDAAISPVAIGILTVGTLGLGLMAAIFCGIFCYRDIAGDNNDDFTAISLMFGIPLLLFAGIGIPAGMIHLRRKSKLSRIPLAVYIAALTVLVGGSLLGNPISRWFSVFLILSLASVVTSIRSAVRYQRAVGG